METSKEKDIRYPHLRTPMMEETDKLYQKGYTAEFRIESDGLRCLQNNLIYNPEQIYILAIDRFEGITNPDDMAILYVIETFDGIKGTVIDAFGIYSDNMLGEFMKKIKVKEGN